MNKPAYRLNTTLKNGEVATHITMKSFVRHITDNIFDILYLEATTMAYSVNLLESIPIRRILTFSETADKGRAFYDIYPELLGLIAANYPEMFDVVSLLIEEERNPQYL